MVGFERTAQDAFHEEEVEGDFAVIPSQQAILEKCGLQIEYNAPHRPAATIHTLIPLGLFWDRDRWYLVGQHLPGENTRIFRVDRVKTIRPRPSDAQAIIFDIRTLLNRKWLNEAMQQWAASAPVRIRLTAAQVDRLKRDWYFSHAQFEPAGDDHFIMTYGEGDRKLVFELVRWLGEGAELLEPHQWREQFKNELAAIQKIYDSLGAI